MARGYGRYGGRGRSSFYKNGPKAQDDGVDKPAQTDKNPHYRTNDIFNGIFRRKGKEAIRLTDSQNGLNYTDGSTIFVKFRDPLKQPIIDLILSSSDDKIYRLGCHHPRTLKQDFPLGKEIDCFICGAHQSYLAFQHEWSHIMFHSFKVAWTLFSDQTADEYVKLAPSIDKTALSQFICLVINAFDDIRCDSLLGRVYSGAAEDIWVRWKRLADALPMERKNEDYISYILAVAVKSETDPNGDFEPLRPVIEWAMDRVRGKGPANMLAIIKIALDRSIGTILKKLPPPPPKQQGNQGQAGAPPPWMPGSASPGSSSPPSDPGDPPPTPPTNAPSGKDLADQGQDITSALQQMMTNAQNHDPTTDHPVPDLATALKDPQVQIARAMSNFAGKALQQDLGAFDQVLQGSTDKDVATALQQLQSPNTQVTPDSQLTTGAKARILFIDVAPQHIDVASHIHLETTEQSYVDSLRSAFYKVMGQQKASRGMEGQEIDIQAAIQYLIETGAGDDETAPIGAVSNPAIFRKITTQQGFSYMILCDMSGSMHHSFHYVARAASMLHNALEFPFVMGDLWGFRGGQTVTGRDSDPGEVWLYRYDRKCKGYLGESPVKCGKHYVMFPVNCDGITPMNSALRVASKHMLVRVPVGMAKRLFILTDGSPLQHKMDGGSLPDWVLRSYVQKEVLYARQHGVQVYTLIIGDDISDDHAKKMFGPLRYWKRVSSYDPEGVGKALFALVKDNFTKYLKVHGG